MSLSLLATLVNLTPNMNNETHVQTFLCSIVMLYFLHIYCFMLVNSRLEKCQLSAQLSTDIEATGMAGNSMKYTDKNMKKTPDDTSLVFQSTS